MEENGELISDDRKIAELFSNYFINITQDLGIQQDIAHISVTDGINDPIDKAIEKYKNHPSIIEIREMYPDPQPFEFREVNSGEIWDQISKLNTRMASPIESISARIFKEYSDIFSEILQRTFNEDLSNMTFPKELKLGDISSLHKKDDKFSKKNYRPFAILPSASKIYERIMESQITPFAHGFLSPLLCGFRRNYSTQHILLRLIENCKKALDTKQTASALLMDLSKAFDCLNHDLMIAKLNAYGFSRSALNFTLSYLSQRKQKVKINGSFSEWKTTSVGVPQGSVLGPLLFNIYINDMFMFISNSQICRYADDTTLYVIHQDIKQAFKIIEQDVVILREWFQNNYMKMNGDKCHLINFGKGSNDTSLKIDKTIIKPSKQQKLLGISIDNNLSFKGHVQSICKKASQKLHALSRISNYMDDREVKQTMQVFILSQFSNLVNLDVL